MPKKISRKIIICIGLIILLGVVSGIMWIDVITKLYPSQSLLEQKKKELKSTTRELRKEIDSSAEIEDLLRRYRMISQNNFITKSEAATLRKRLETAAGKHQVTVSSIGTPNETDLRGGSAWRINFSGTGSLKSMMEFFEELSSKEKKLFWQRFNLRPMSSRDSDNLRLTATICAFSIDDKGKEELGTEKETKPTAPKNQPPVPKKRRRKLK